MPPSLTQPSQQIVGVLRKDGQWRLTIAAKHVGSACADAQCATCQGGRMLEVEAAHVQQRLRDDYDVFASVLARLPTWTHFLVGSDVRDWYECVRMPREFFDDLLQYLEAGYMRKSLHGKRKVTSEFHARPSKRQTTSSVRSALAALLIRMAHGCGTRVIDMFLGASAGQAARMIAVMREVVVESLYEREVAWPDAAERHEIAAGGARVLEGVPGAERVIGIVDGFEFKVNLPSERGQGANGVHAVRALVVLNPLDRRVLFMKTVPANRASACGKALHSLLARTVDYFGAGEPQGVFLLANGAFASCPHVLLPIAGIADESDLLNHGGDTEVAAGATPAPVASASAASASAAVAASAAAASSSVVVAAVVGSDAATASGGAEVGDDGVPVSGANGAAPSHGARQTPPPPAAPAHAPLPALVDSSRLIVLQQVAQRSTDERVQQRVQHILSVWRQQIDIAAGDILHRWTVLRDVNTSKPLAWKAEVRTAVALAAFSARRLKLPADSTVWAALHVAAAQALGVQ